MLTIFNASPPLLSSTTTNPTSLLSITGASLHEARNSPAVLDKIAETAPLNSADAYRDLTKKACSASFKNKQIASLIASRQEADPACLQVIAINIFLLKDMPGADPKISVKLQKCLETLGEMYCKEYNKQFSAGDDLRSFVASHNLNRSAPYKLYCELTKKLNIFLRSVPDAYDHARSRLHQDYLKEGLVGNFQNVHGVTLDHASADNISREGNGSSFANTVLENQFARAKLERTSASLNDTVLISLSQLDFERKTVARVVS